MAILKQTEKRKTVRQELYASFDASGVDIPTALKQLRQVLGWDQSALAKAAGISLSALRRIEQGHKNVRLDTLEKVLTHFGLKLVVKRSDAFQKKG
jgi:transcriptional regulator with XRE-family HTH domain